MWLRARHDKNAGGDARASMSNLNKHIFAPFAYFAIQIFNHETHENTRKKYKEKRRGRKKLCVLCG